MLEHLPSDLIMFFSRGKQMGPYAISFRNNKNIRIVAKCGNLFFVLIGELTYHVFCVFVCHFTSPCVRTELQQQKDFSSMLQEQHEVPFFGTQVREPKLENSSFLKLFEPRPYFFEW